MLLPGAARGNQRITTSRTIAKGPCAVDTSGDARGTTGNEPPNRGRLRSILMTLIFDVAAPLVAYYALRSAGMSSVAALLISGVSPAIGVGIRAVWHRRLDVVGVLVLAGIIVGTLLGLITGSARLLLVEGSVPTAVFGFACLATLWSRRPLIFSFALEFIGPGTAQGREMTELMQYEPFRRIFRNMTLVWGIGFLVEAALRVVIVYNTSPGTALAVSKVTPYLFIAVLMTWTIGYGRYHRKKAERGGPRHPGGPPAGDDEKLSGAAADGSASIAE